MPLMPVPLSLVVRVAFAVLRDGPLEKLWGGATYKKNIRAREK